MKNRIVKLIGMVIVFSMFALPVFAASPSPRGSCMDNRAFIFLMPLTNEYLGSETKIYGENDVI